MPSYGLPAKDAQDRFKEADSNLAMKFKYPNSTMDISSANESTGPSMPENGDDDSSMTEHPVGKGGMDPEKGE